MDRVIEERQRVEARVVIGRADVRRQRRPAAEPERGREHHARQRDETGVGHALGCALTIPSGVQATRALRIARIRALFAALCAGSA